MIDTQINRARENQRKLINNEKNKIKFILI